MKKRVTMTMDEKLFKILSEHLFPGGDDEHGAVICVGVCETNDTIRLLVREIFLAKDGVDYVPGTRGYRALTAQFVAEKSDYCYQNNLGYIAVHCHGGADYVRFSEDDYASHKRGYPALLDIPGGPVGALVFASNAVAGEIYFTDGIYELDFMTIIGSRIRKLYPEPIAQTIVSNPIYDRHARLFGDLGQQIIGNLKVGIVGLGGGGSLLNEWLSRLGVGHIVAIDFDKIEGSNVPRIVGATRQDAQVLFQKSKFRLIRNIGKRLSRYKVHVARRVARKANPKIKYDAVVGDILDESTALKLKDCDFIFLASDSIKSRNVFNALLHQYLIPGAQVGAKVRSDESSGKVTEIFTAGRLIIPYSSGGCLYCNGWIPQGRLTYELSSDEEKNAQNYVDNVVIAEPSVITLNVLSAAQIINDFMMLFTGLYEDGVPLTHHYNYVLERLLIISESRQDPHCLSCGIHKRSRYAKGDRKQLPCREKK